MFGTDANASTTWERAPFLVQSPTSNLQSPISNRNTELLETPLTRWKQRTRHLSNRDIREHLRSLLGALRPQRLCGASSPFRRSRVANQGSRLLQPPRRRSLFASSSNLQLRTSSFQKTESSARTRTQFLIDHTRKLESTVTRRKQTTEVISNRPKMRVALFSLLNGLHSGSSGAKMNLAAPHVARAAAAAPKGAHGR